MIRCCVCYERITGLDQETEDRMLRLEVRSGYAYPVRCAKCERKREQEEQDRAWTSSEQTA
jgi:hypothetical protein